MRFGEPPWNVIAPLALAAMLAVFWYVYEHNPRLTPERMTVKILEKARRK